MYHRLAEIHRLMESRKDTVRRDRIQDLIRKDREKEFSMAFCGHFSAGKSTLLNRLYGENLLPTSPVPTSANVVRVRPGEHRVVLTLVSGKKKIYRGPYTEEDLKALCQNGDEVTAVDVYRPDAPFPKGVALLDTPGVDSTDEAHQRVTESALHLADAIFYVMDYNHVQSEGNLRFLRRMKERNKRIFPVINQIDKHREEELSFHRFRERVEETFRAWGLDPDPVFYTSIREPEHPHNQMPRLKAQVDELIRDREALLKESLSLEAEYLIREHLSHLKEQKRNTIEEITDGLEEPLPPLEELDREYAEWKERREGLDREIREVEREFRNGLEDLLHNAYLMSYENRERARRYLETELTKFRVGWFLSKGKTKKEREERFRDFYEKLKQTVDTQLDFHVKQYLIGFLKQQGIHTEERAEAVYGLESPFRPELLKETIKEGAGMTGDYLLKYTGDLAGRIKQGYSRQAQALFDSYVKILKEQTEARREEAEDRIRKLETLRKKAAEVDRLHKEHSDWEENLRLILDGTRAPEIRTEPDVFWEEEPEETGSIFPNEERSGEAGPGVEKPGTVKEPDPSKSVERTREALRCLREAESAMKDIKALRSIGDDLAGKRKRVENRRFTVALFGAFSAGKSSFANAWLGREVLPVSPNPTTAAINRITAPEGDYGHGDVLIHFKSEAGLLEELREAFGRFGKSADSLRAAVQDIGELLSVSDPDPAQQTVFPFLRAVREGYDELSEMLGQTRRFPLKAFGSFAARESRSCLVEMAELFYDCPLTRRGVTLVDTPGADSIHARHTEVAFRYIKEADAILFVTYYNHAFSRADREFLIQLGRVKDAFSMDKMFFIMNAADLAASDQERAEVSAYLRDQLLQYGIRHPRMFAVSSLKALKEGEEKDRIAPPAGSGMKAFREAFTEFLEVDLMSVSLHGMEADLRRADAVLKRLAKEVRQGNEEKRRKMDVYGREKKEVLSFLSEVDPRSDEQALSQEIEELFYYVKQRLFLRYNDVFTEIFHPSALKGVHAKKRLYSCIREMIEFLRQDLMQELRATSLRVERWFSGRLERVQASVRKECLRWNDSLSLAEFPGEAPEPPEWKEPFPSLDPEAFKKAANLFKNSRDFFEKNGKLRMREAMKTELEPAVDRYLREEQSRWIPHYVRAWREEAEALKRKMADDVLRHYDHVLEALSDQADPLVYERTGKFLADRIEELEQHLRS